MANNVYFCNETEFGDLTNLMGESATSVTLEIKSQWGFSWKVVEITGGGDHNFRDLQMP